MEVLLLARDGKYMDNKWKVKFPKIYKEKLQMADIGGIGNICLLYTSDAADD